MYFGFFNQNSFNVRSVNIREHIDDLVDAKPVVHRVAQEPERPFVP